MSVNISEIAFPAKLLNYIALSWDYYICPDHLSNLKSVRHHKESSFNRIYHVSFFAAFVVKFNTQLILNLTSFLL